MMLSKEQEALLRWLDSQPAPVSLAAMDRDSAPHFSHQRIEEMRKSGLIARGISFECDQMVGVYSVSDAGKAMLLELEEKQEEKSEAKAEKKDDRKFQARLSISSAVFGALVGALLTLLVEHFHEIVNCLAALL